MKISGISAPSIVFQFLETKKSPTIVPLRLFVPVAQPGSERDGGEVLELLEKDNGNLFPEALRFKRTHRREAPLHKCRCGTGLIGAYSTILQVRVGVERWEQHHTLVLPMSMILHVLMDHYYSANRQRFFSVCTPLGFATPYKYPSANTTSMTTSFIISQSFVSPPWQVLYTQALHIFASGAGWGAGISLN